MEVVVLRMALRMAEQDFGNHKMVGLQSTETVR